MPPAAPPGLRASDGSPSLPPCTAAATSSMAWRRGWRCCTRPSPSRSRFSCRLRCTPALAQVLQLDACASGLHSGRKRVSVVQDASWLPAA